MDIMRAMDEYNPYNPMETQERKSPLKWILIVAIIIIVVIFAILLLKPSSKPATTQANIPAPVSQFSFNFVFVSSIDSNFTYTLQPNTNYNLNQPIILYLEATNFMETNNFVNVTEDIDIRDSQGKIVLTRAAFGSFANSVSLETSVIKFTNIVPTGTLVPGTYSLRIRFDDNIAKISSEKTATFTIIPVPVVYETTNISRILSSDVSQTNIIREQTVLDQQGKIIPELTYNQTLVVDFSTLNTSVINVPVKIPEQYPSGNYTVKIIYLNLANGKSISQTETVVANDQFSIESFVFANSIGSSFNYVVQPNSIYPSGSAVYVYLKVIGFDQVPVYNGYATNLTEDVVLIGGSGNIISSKPDYLIINDATPAKRDAYQLKTVFNAGLNTGMYTLKVTVTDLNSGLKTTRAENFWIS